MKPLKNKVSITLDSDIIEQLKLLAEQDDRSFSQYLNMILKEYLTYASPILAVFHLFLVCTVHTFSHYIMLSSNSKFNF